MAHFNFEFYSKSLARRFTCDLVIPSLNLHTSLMNKDDSYYQNRVETYPLMICLCGFGDNKEAWQRQTSILDLAEKNNFAALFIDGENSWYLNRGPIADYERLIDVELTDFLYGNFKNLSKEKPLIIAGVSMGGYGALQHYLRHPDLYSACIALSPATKADQIDEKDFGGSLKEHFLANKGKKLNVYLSVGKKDFIIEASREFDGWLSENQIGVNYRYIPNADHSWATWKEEIYSVINYLKNKGLIHPTEMPPRQH